MYKIHEIFKIDENGTYDSVGFGVFAPDGSMVAFFATCKEAQSYIKELEEGDAPSGTGSQKMR